VKSDSFSQESATHSPHLTRNQQAVLDVLHQQADALSAQELFSLLRERQAIGLATVYRALIAWIDQKPDGCKRRSALQSRCI
jgi:Fe2+ or Zn2+ uptake regulation protein